MGELEKLPEPGEVPSDYVMACLDMESEGDGMLYAALMKDRLLYATQTKYWYIWSGWHWDIDKKQRELGFVRYVVDRYGMEIDALEKRIEESKQKNSPEDHEVYKKGWDQKIRKLQGRISKLRGEWGAQACVKFAWRHHQSPLTVVGDEFDRDPWLLGVQGGVVDLRSGELKAPDQTLMVSKRCSCSYEPEKGYPNWSVFLREIYDNDEELISFLQRLFGYGLSGMTNINIFPFLIGSGRNGKTMLIETILRVMGDYAGIIPVDMFLQSNLPRSRGQADPAIMELEGKRLVISSEVEEGSRFSAEQVKRLTGGETLSGRNPYDRAMRTFSPTHLAIMVGNHEPVPPAGDPAFWRRTILIRHPISFVPGEPEKENERKGDPLIAERLKSLDGEVLAWMVEGCLLWQRDEMLLSPPASVLRDTEEYQGETDYIQQFLDACCELGGEGAKMGSTELYTAFVVWYRENVNSRKNFTPSHRSFGLKMKRRDELKKTTSGGAVQYLGVTLNETWYARMLDVAMGRE